jgi:hypothetical protein
MKNKTKNQGLTSQLITFLRLTDPMKVCAFQHLAAHSHPSREVAKGCHGGHPHQN